MIRQLLVPVALAVVLVPDWAAAFNPCVCPPPVVPYCPPVIVPAPVVGCVPTTGTIAPPEKGPTIVPERAEPPKKAPVASETPKIMPTTAEQPAAPKPPEPMTIKPVEPKPEPRVVVPPTGADRIPAPAVPLGSPPAKGDGGKWELDLPPLAKPQPAEVPSAPPAKSEKPKEPGKITPFSFDVPKGDGPAQPVEANKTTVANSSPLTDRPTEVDVYPREGDGATGRRGVKFVNKSARDILLTIDGKTTTLPSKTVLSVEVAAAFTWQLGGETERTQKVPDGSPGVDVIIRK
ncbi:MAG: hypothetical protein MUF18_12915 [Fimbriiglobus sp.]|nr:hypothetical protein [Fimbriiglobus sp.]